MKNRKIGRKRGRFVTKEDGMPSKRQRFDIKDEDSEIIALQDNRKGEELVNTPQAKQYIPHNLIALMYQLDLSVLCLVRESVYTNKYPSLSLKFASTEIHSFNDIILGYEEKFIHIQIEYVHKHYIDEDINYVKLFSKEKLRFSIYNYLESFVKLVISKPAALYDTKYLIIYTNSRLNLTKENKLMKIRAIFFYPFRFDDIHLDDCDILKDFLWTNDSIHNCGFYQFSKDKTTREELLKRLEFSLTSQENLKEKSLSQAEVKEAFLDKLVLAVNQPNREKLNSIIKIEIDKVKYEYIALREKILCELTSSKKLWNYVSGITNEFNILMQLLHDMFLHDNLFSINFTGKCHLSNEFIINYKDKTTYLKAHNADSRISYSKLSSSKNVFSINGHFALFIEGQMHDIRHFIIYTNADLNLTEKKRLESRFFYPLKFNSIDIRKNKYEILRDCSCIDEDGLYKLSQEESTRENVLSLLKLPHSLQKEKEEGRLTDEKEKEIKDNFLNRLIFAVNQRNQEELNSAIKNNISKANVPYNYEELHEIALRWSESHELGHVTKRIMQKLLEDEKNNRSSYKEIENKNIKAEIEFAKRLVGRKDTYSFNHFLDFLIKDEGIKCLAVLKRNGIKLSNMSSILGGAGAKAPIAFKDLYDVWFDTRGNKTQYLKTLEKEGINLSNISSILNKARAKAPAVFKDLYDLWFDEKGNKTQYLKALEKEGINLPNISSILSGARANAPTAFKDLYDLWFDAEGNKTQYLKILKEEKISLTIMSSILSGAGAKAPAAFRDLYNLWFDEEGNKTQCLKTIKEAKLNLANISSILSGSGAKAPAAFNDLYDVWFDLHGNKTQYLKTLEEEGINLTNVSSILHGVGANAAIAFKNLYDLWFDVKSNKTHYLKTLEEEGINLTNISSILHGVGFNAAKEFKNIYHLWFDMKDNKTPYLKILEDEGISLSIMSSILHGAGSDATTAFKDLFDLWFDAKGNKTQYLITLQQGGIHLTNLSSILGRSGTNIAKAFKDLYNLWFDTNGNKTLYLKTLEKEGVNLSNMSSILGGTGTGAATAFKDIYDLWFDAEGNKTQYLKTLKKEKINLTTLSSILSGAGAKAPSAFKDLYDVWFNAKGNKTKYLRTLEQEGINLSNISSILNGAGVNSAKAFKKLYDIWFDEKGNKTHYLKILGEKGIDLNNMSSMLHGAGAKAPKAFKELCNTFLDDKGDRKQHLKHFLEKTDGGRSFELHNLSSILSKAGVKSTDAFEQLHNICFDDEGKRTELLDDFYKAGFSPSNISSALCGTGTRASSNLKRLHSVCFNEKRKITKVLGDFYKVGFRPSNICSMLSGATDNLEKFHDFCFERETKRYLNHFLNEEEHFALRKLSKILHGAGANICAAFKDFHDVYFDEEEKKTQLVEDFHQAGFTLNDLSNILSMAGNNAASILTNFHKVCFNNENYLNHFLVEEEHFTPKNLSRILHGVGINVHIIFEKLHGVCFDRKGNQTKYLSYLIENNPLALSDILHGQVKLFSDKFLQFN